MKRIVLLISVVVIVATAAFFVKSNGEDGGTSTENQSTAAPTTATEPSSETGQPALTDRFVPSQALLQQAVLCVEIDGKGQPIDSLPPDLRSILLSRPATRIIDDFSKNVPPEVLRAVKESGKLLQRRLSLTLLESAQKDPKAPPPFVLCGIVGDATETVKDVLTKNLAPLVAGPNAGESEEKQFGINVYSRTGPTGGLFWVFAGGEFAVCADKALLVEFLGKSAKPLSPTETFPEQEPAEQKRGPLGDGELFAISIDINKAIKAGILPPTPDPNFPLILSGLSPAKGFGFDKAFITYTPSDLGGRLTVGIHTPVPVSPYWQSIKMGPAFFDLIPADTIAALGTALPGRPTDNAPGGQEAPSRSPVETSLEKAAADLAPLVRSIFAREGEPVIVGALPVNDADGSQAFFAVAPFPEDATGALLLDWIKQIGGAVETAELDGRTAYGIDFSQQPALTGSEIEQLGFYFVDNKIVAGTSPETLSRFRSGKPTDVLSAVPAFNEMKPMLGGESFFRAYFDGEFLRRSAAMYTDGALNGITADQDTRFLIGTIINNLDSLYAAGFADSNTLRVELVSRSNLAPIAALFILNEAATSFLTESD